MASARRAHTRLLGGHAESDYIGALRAKLDAFVRTCSVLRQGAGEPAVVGEVMALLDKFAREQGTMWRRLA